MLDNADNTGSLLWTEEELTALFETAEPPARLGATSVGVEAGSKFFLFCACFLLEKGGGGGKSAAGTSIFSQSKANSSLCVAPVGAGILCLYKVSSNFGSGQSMILGGLYDLLARRELRRTEALLSS